MKIFGLSTEKMDLKKLIRRGVVDFIKRKTLIRKQNCRYDNQTRKKQYCVN